MKILVPVKRVVDHNVAVRVAPDGSGVITDNVKMSMNPFDENAVEQAVALREAGLDVEIIIFSIGPQKASETIRTALAMGGDRGIHIETDEAIETLDVAKVLASAVKKFEIDLVLLGKQAIDTDYGHTGQMLAGLMNWPQATFVSHFSLEDNQIRIEREVEGGTQGLSLTLPSVVTVDLHLNKPRYISLPQMMKAKKLPIETMGFDDFDVTPKTRLKVIDTKAPEPRQRGEMVPDVETLVARLKEQTEVLSS